MQQKKLLVLFMILAAMAVTVVQAQDASNIYAGVVAACGEDALTIHSADSLPEDETTQALDNLLRQMVTFPAEGETPLQDGVPGPAAVILVDSPSGRYFRSIGAGDLESCAPVDPNNPFPIGSNTKMFTATVIYQLQEEGLLATSDLVSQYLPDEIALWPGAETITIDMLLGHTGGLPDYLNSKSPASLGSRLLEPGMLERTFTPEELVANSAEADPQLLFEPGSAGNWSYSNTGYVMLGMIIEKVTGQSYSDAVTQRIIEPLGLQHTVLVDGVAPADLGLVGQYLIDKQTLEVIDMAGWNFSQAWSAGAAVSTPEDLATFERALYSGDLFQDPATLEAYTTRAAPGFRSQADNFYYMHGGFNKGGFLGHGGQTLGTESDPGYNPASNTVIITWSNTAYAYTGAGVFHVGHVLGLTPSWNEVFSNLGKLTLTDMVGLTLNALQITDASGASTDIPQGSAYSLTLSADGQATIVADCNTVMASYTEGENSALSIDLGASTLVACAEGSLADGFLATLGNASSLLIVDIGSQYLVIVQTADGSAVTFGAAK